MRRSDKPIRARVPGGLLGWLGLVGLLLAVGCGEDIKRKKRRGVDQPPGKAPAANLKDVGKPSADLVAEKHAKSGKKKRKKRKKGSLASLPPAAEFTEKDFVENDQESRDPFRNLLIKEPIKATGPSLIEPGDVVYLKDYPLGELKVTGIVGGRRRYAMVLDPRTGRTTILKKRDRVSKERALIFEINRDHLVLLVPRIRPNKADPYERRKLYVDETRKIVDIGSDTLRPDQSGIRYSSSRGRTRRGGRSKER